jgi:hypothetical protein
MQLLVLDEANHHIDSSFPDVLLSLLMTLNPMHLEALAVVLVAHSDSDNDQLERERERESSSTIERRLSAIAQYHGKVDVLRISSPMILEHSLSTASGSSSLSHDGHAIERQRDKERDHEISAEAWQAGYDTAIYLQHLYHAETIQEKALLNRERGEDREKDSETDESETYEHVPRRFILTHSKIVCA